MNQNKSNQNLKIWNVLNLGAGVQSSVVLLMMKHEILPKVHCAIFADTGWEPKAVYKHLDWLEEEMRGIVPIIRVSDGNLREDTIQGIEDENKHRPSMPVFLRNLDKSQGMAKRHCTRNYKIVPINKYIRHVIFGCKPYYPTPKNYRVRQFFGISRDEMRRVRQSKYFWSENVYPLINLPDKFLDYPMSRQDCIDYSERHLPRSACLACPFHTDEEWLYMKENAPDEFQDAVEFEKFIQEKQYGYDAEPYLHRSLKSLNTIDFKARLDKNKAPESMSDLMADINADMAKNTWSEECEGMCGV